MRQKLTRRQTVWLGIGAVLVFLFADAFVTPPAHDVHTLGATALNARLIESSARLVTVVPPSESIGDVRCRLWQENNGNTQCPADVAQIYFPSVIEEPRTLYVPWTGCLSWTGSGAITDWQGYNVEYLASGRTLVIHCYTAERWLTRHPTLFGVVAIPRAALLVVPTNQMGTGPIHIVEDDRLEHLVGDWNTEYQIGTATVDQSSPTRPPPIA